jgi:hypothetical protein
MPLRIAPYTRSKDLDLSMESLRVETGIRRSRVYAGKPPALITSAGVVEDGVVQV